MAATANLSPQERALTGARQYAEDLLQKVRLGTEAARLGIVHPRSVEQDGQRAERIRLIEIELGREAAKKWGES